MPKKDAFLGRSLIKAHKRRYQSRTVEGYRHTSDLADSHDDHAILQSVTEETSLEAFLNKVSVEDQNYELEQEEVKLVKGGISDGLLSEAEKELVFSAQLKNKSLLRVPRRPPWNKDMSKQELDAQEMKSFDVWKQDLSVLEKEEHIILTPFERNLEFWRQLWRVLERSDVIVQILDARNPLLFRCPDLEEYAKELDEKKINILLLNKADLLTEKQRQHWCDYFEEVGIKVVFYSALDQADRHPEENEESEPESISKETSLEKIENNPKLYSREQLIAFLKSLSREFKFLEHIPTIGLVGYPNVGKSSTVNSLLMCKKVSVSATPGKTKHFQTHNIDEDLCLCDCPGLVFPNFVSTRAEMVVNGILPIDVMRDWNQPVSLVTNLIPRHVLQTTYNIIIPPPGEGREPDSAPTANEFLSSHAYNRGYMTARGLADSARSARYVLKHFVSGKLLYCTAPPGVKQEDYHQFEISRKRNKVIVEENLAEEPIEQKQLLTDADKKFFRKSQQIHTKGKMLIKTNPDEIVGKPWKKRHNGNRKEKLRRLYPGRPYDD